MASDNSSRDSRQLRPLLPAPARRETSTRDASQSLFPRPNRRSVKIACEACKQRKSRCSGDRPSCHYCVSRGIDCSYRDLADEASHQAVKEKLEEYGDFYAYLQSRSTEEVASIIHMVRSGSDVSSVLHFIREGDLMAQLTIAPDTRHRYDFPFITSIPASLHIPGNSYLDSIVYKATVEEISSSGQPPVKGTLSNAKYEELYLTPYRMAEVVHPRFDQVRASPWTTVISDDNLLRRLLSIYFLYEHVNFPAFNMDYFLDDMARGAEQFCSPLLVNAVLAKACNCDSQDSDRANFWSPHHLERRFFSEATRLWDLEVEKKTLTTVQAGLVLNLAFSANSLNQLGLMYLMPSIAIAQDLNIFAEPAVADSKEMRNSKSFTSWCMFTYQVTQGYYQHKAPFLPSPPLSPLPDPTEDPAWYGEMYIRYPRSPAIWRVHFGHTFKCRAKLRTILNDIACQSFELDPTEGNISSTDIKRIQDRLEAWYNELPEPLTPKKAILPCHLLVHYERHDSFLPWFHIFLGNMVAADLEGQRDQLRAANTATLDALRSTLLLCVKGTHDQGQIWLVAALMYTALHDRMPAEDVNLFQTCALPNRFGDDSTPLVHDLYVHRPAPVTKIGTPSIPTLEIVAQLYDGISLGETLELTAPDTETLPAVVDGAHES